MRRQICGGTPRPDFKWRVEQREDGAGWLSVIGPGGEIAGKVVALDLGAPWPHGDFEAWRHWAKVQVGRFG
jgi:hypothetical protein